MKKGIDVSKWQGSIDWQKVKNAGIEFAVLREGYGKKNPAQIDSKFKEYYNGATGVGIPVGVYHYSYAANVQDAKEEAEFCLENIKGLNIEYPVCFDIEDKEQLKLSTRQRTDIVAAFCETIEKAGFYAMVYCNMNWWVNYLYKDELAKRFDLWLAQWGVQAPSVDCGLWQYTDRGKVDGISGNVDLDYAYNDYREIIKNKNLNKAGASQKYEDYIIGKNDTLWSIAQKTLGNGARWPEIQKLNNIKGTTIYAGQTLKIPR